MTLDSRLRRLELEHRHRPARAFDETDYSDLELAEMIARLRGGGITAQDVLEGLERPDDELRARAADLRAKLQRTANAGKRGNHDAK
jgi:hypothetical protein